MRGYLFEAISDIDTSLVNHNNFIALSNYVIYTSGSAQSIYFPNNYWGTTDTEKIRKMYSDFWSDPSAPFLDINPILNSPSDSAHTVTWKILVNTKDAQDEYVDPVGVGPQRFDIYFSRVMDTTFTPQVTFGVRYPYTQQTVADSGY